MPDIITRILEEQGFAPETFAFKYLLYSPEGIHMEETMKYLVKLL